MTQEKNRTSISPEGELVDEVEGDGPLPDAHLLRLEFGRVIVTDLAYQNIF